MKFPASSSYILLQAQYLPQHPILDTLSLCSSLNVRNQVSHPYKTIDKTTGLYILICKLLDTKWEDRFLSKW
jgi:hypothetical protein